MSIFDENLLKNLQEIGAKFNKKYAQSKDISPLDVAKNLINGLKPEIDSLNNKFSTQTNENVSPSMNDLNSLDRLIGFLAKNLVQLNGKLIAFSPDNLIDTPYTIDQNALKEYLLKLHSDAVSSKNSLFILVVNKLITEANSKYSFNINIANSIKSNQDQDNFQIDTVPTIINLNNPYEPGFDKKLLVKDLDSKSSFASWIRSAPETQISETGKQAVDITNDNICHLINYLYTRSNSLDKNDIAGKSESLKEIYKNKISNISSLYSCSLSKNYSTFSEGNEASAYLPEDANDQVKKAISTALSSISLSLPFGSNAPDAIDLNQLSRFFNTIQKSLIPLISYVKTNESLLAQDKDFIRLKNFMQDLKDEGDNLSKWANDGTAAISSISSSEKLFPWNFNNLNENQNQLILAFHSSINAIGGSAKLIEIVYNAQEIVRTLYKSSFATSIKSQLDTQYSLAKNYLSQLQRVHEYLLNSK